MTIDILRKTGGWLVELQQPLKHHGKDVLAVELRAATANTVIRWEDGKFLSTLGMVSEMSGLPERLLRELDAKDLDRVLLALSCMLPPVMQEAMRTQRLPLATPDDEMNESQKLPVDDQIDPRFPAVDGPVHRMKPKEPPKSDDEAMNLSPPGTVEAA